MGTAGKIDNSFQLTVDSGQLTVIGATNVVHFDPSVKVCRERPMCRSAPERTELLPINPDTQNHGTKASPPGKLARPLAETDEGRGSVKCCRNNRRKGNPTESHRRERPMCRSVTLQLQLLWTKRNHPPIMSFRANAVSRGIFPGGCFSKFLIFYCIFLMILK